jgi:hypothetical protein
MAPDGKPYTQIHQNCAALIRTLPNLIYDETRPEIIDKKGTHEDDNNDDPFDAWSLGLLTIWNGKSAVVTSKPPQPDKQEGYIVGPDGRMKDLHVDIGAMLKSNNKQDRDWRYR